MKRCCLDYNGFCPVCGVSWECEHRIDPERDRLVYVRLDGPTPRKQLQEAVAAIEAAGAAIKGLAVSVRGTAAGLQRFKAAWDTLPDATKEEVRRLDTLTDSRA